MLRLLLPLAALVASGCFVDSLGLPPPSGGAGDGGSSNASGGAGGEPAVNGGGPQGGTPPEGGSNEGGTGGAPSAVHCPPGEVATNIVDGALTCAPPDDAIITAVAESCAVFYGWRDNCNVGCTSPPDRIGKVTGTSCTEPPSGDSTCQVVDLGSDTGVQLFGWDLDGGADDGDRFYSAISCIPGASDVVACDGGGWVTGYDGDTAVCSRLSGAALDYVRPSCALVRGWRDQCDGCTMDPTKYVASTSVACNQGVGGLCAATVLGPDTVELASFDTDAIVNEDDKFYFGLRCDTVSSTEASAEGSCPAGQFVVGLEADGALVCSDLQEASMTAFRKRCSLFAGWRDNCDACTNAPSKWGRVRDGDCTNNGQTNDTCSTMMLGGQTVDLYGLNLDGGVNGNDKFYMGFRCE